MFHEFVWGVKPKGGYGGEVRNGKWLEPRKAEDGNQ